MQVVPRCAVERMRLEDIPAVQAIEREVFLSPWPRNAYRNELLSNRHATYIVLRREGEVSGYGGLWKVQQEAHITTIGVRATEQGHGYGKALFIALLQRAYGLGAHWVTLEVRRSNEHAMGLYESFGFTVIGRRRGYYTDNGEDAIIMWSNSIHAPAFKRTFVHRMDGIDIPGIGPAPSPEYPLS